MKALKRVANGNAVISRKAASKICRKRDTCSMFLQAGANSIAFLERHTLPPDCLSRNISLGPSHLRSKAFGATRDQRGKTNPSSQHSVPALATSSLWVSISATAPCKASLIRPKVSKHSFYFPSGWPLLLAHPLPRKPTLPSHLCGSHLYC